MKQVTNPNIEVSPFVVQLAVGILSEVLTQDEINTMPLYPFKEVKDVLEKRKGVLIEDLITAQPFGCAARIASDYIKRFVKEIDAPATLPMMRCMRIVEVAKNLNELAWDLFRVNLKTGAAHIGLQALNGKLSLWEFDEEEEDQGEDEQAKAKKAFMKAMKKILG